MYSEKDRETEKYLESFLEHKVDLEDTFEFGCKQCGNCCRNRDEPIMIMGYDLYNIAKALNLSPVDALGKYTKGILGEDSKLPIAILKERLDGSCSLLRKGKCTIQEDKPITCRIYPLGRFFDGKQFIYIKQDNECKGEKKEIKVKDWLVDFHIFEMDEPCLMWTQMVMTLAKYMQKLLKKNNPEKIKDFQDTFLYAMYLRFDMEKSLMDNLRETKKYLETEYPEIKF